MSSSDHTLEQAEGGEHGAGGGAELGGGGGVELGGGGELEALKIQYEEERQRSAQREEKMAERMAVLESKMAQQERRGEQPRAASKVYRVTRGGSGILCPTIDFPGSGCCKTAMVGQRWKTLLGLYGHLDKVTQQIKNNK